MVDRLVNSEVNARRIAIVESGFGSSGQPLAVPGRVLVGEGVLTKMCRKKAKTRQFFLFNDILVYGNIVINKKKYNQQHVIPLEEVKLEALADDDTAVPALPPLTITTGVGGGGVGGGGGVMVNYRNGWLVRTRTKSFAVYAATAAEKAEWMAHINKCVDDLLKKSGKQGATEHAAVWVPDTEAKCCMHCRVSHFSLINRRHHCRKCGRVVCGPCSNKKWLLPGQSRKTLRVCNSCYDQLATAAASANITTTTTSTSSANINNNNNITTNQGHDLHTGDMNNSTVTVDSSTDDSDDDDLTNGDQRLQHHQQPDLDVYMTHFYEGSSATAEYDDISEYIPSNTNTSSATTINQSANDVA